MDAKFKGFVCQDSRPCGGRDARTGRCRPLESGYPDGKCPFCKPDFNYTNGEYYGYDPILSGSKLTKYSALGADKKKNVRTYISKGEFK